MQAVALAITTPLAVVSVASVWTQVAAIAYSVIIGIAYLIGVNSMPLEDEALRIAATFVMIAPLFLILGFLSRQFDPHTYLTIKHWMEGIFGVFLTYNIVSILFFDGDLPLTLVSLF